MSRQNKLDTVDGADIVIVGNGIAGLTAAVEARKHAPDRRIVVVTKQNHPTINTPALKQFAIGKLTREQLLSYPTVTERTKRIHIVNSWVE
jgi:NADH dehydrogenase FAD-containing subunit